MKESADLTAKTIVVTGAASGIGRATAVHAQRAGARVVGLDVAAGTAPFELIQCDVSSASDVTAAFDAIASAHTTISGLVNTAGVGGEPGDVVATSEEFFDRTIAVNLTGVFLASRAAIPLLRRHGGGSIVHVASQLGMVGTTNSPAYVASKGGVVAMGRAMALDHAKEDIRVNVVCPGPVDTPMFAASSGPGNIATLLAETIPIGRLGTADDIAALCVFLLSDAASYMTGSIIPIDGGYTAR